MCTYETEHVPISGSGKGPSGWFSLSAATVYFDHPVHAAAEHTLNVDFLNPGLGPQRRGSRARPGVGTWSRVGNPGCGRRRPRRSPGQSLSNKARWHSGPFVLGPRWLY